MDKSAGREPLAPPARSVPLLPRNVERVVACALERKAIDLRVLDLRGLSDATDFFVIATGSSDIHVRAIADNILTATRDPALRPVHTEGLEEGRWVLIDFIDLVVHIFHPERRDFYNLETLWGDAPAFSPGDPATDRAPDGP